MGEMKHPFDFKLLKPGPVWISRAPGRLDLMGGIADYCGSLVLETPLDLSAWVALQKTGSASLQARNLGAHAPFHHTVQNSLDHFYADGKLVSPEAASRVLTQVEGDAWAAYLLGVFYMLLHWKWIERFPEGAILYLNSQVPWGAGVSSSAALEVAAVQAVCAAYGIKRDGVQKAQITQATENLILHSPCGIMDQATSLLGRKDHLLALECRPCTPRGHVAIPKGYGVFGINSAVKHKVGGSQYGRVRTATRMGQTLLAKQLGQPVDSLFLSTLVVRDYEMGLRKKLPEKMAGSDFLAEFGPLADQAVKVDPAQQYDVRRCVDHPVYEGERVERFGELLTKADKEEHEGHRESILAQAGSLMAESHRSYSNNCGLGSPETDLLVEGLMKLGPEKGIFGAKISGGGAGGTVVILARKSAGALVDEVAAEYARKTGKQPQVFSGSSEGAIVAGVEEAVV